MAKMKAVFNLFDASLEQEKNIQFKLEHLLNETPEHSESNKDGEKKKHKSKRTKADAIIFLDANLPEIIVVVKAEFGGKSETDPVVQCCVTYHQFTHLFFMKKPINQVIMPSILMLILGRCVCFYGVVSHFHIPSKSRYILCDHLETIHFDQAFKDSNTRLLTTYAMVRALHAVIPKLNVFIGRKLAPQNTTMEQGVRFLSPIAITSKKYQQQSPKFHQNLFG